MEAEIAPAVKKRRVTKWILWLLVIVEIVAITELSITIFKKPHVRPTYESLITHNIGGTWEFRSTPNNPAYGTINITDNSGILQGTTRLTSGGDTALGDVSGHVINGNQVYINLMVSGVMINIVGKMNNSYEIKGSFTLNTLFLYGKYNVTFSRELINVPTTTG